MARGPGLSGSRAERGDAQGGFLDALWLSGKGVEAGLGTPGKPHVSFKTQSPHLLNGDTQSSCLLWWRLTESVC